MPTVILLDCGLSMGRLTGKKEREIVKPATPKSPQEITIDDDVEIRHLALHGISQLLTQIETNCRLEQVALVTYSSMCEVPATFTRDIDLVRTKLSLVSCQDKSLLEAGLVGLVSLVAEEWGAAANLNINVVIVTDGSLGYGPHSLSHLANNGPSELKTPLPFSCTVSVVCLADKVSYIRHDR